MLINCPYCRSRVDAKVHGERDYHNPEEDPYPYKVAVLSCPSYGNTLVGIQENEYDPHQNACFWSNATRPWPSPGKLISWLIPDTLRDSLQEADRCFRAGAYTACAAMCGRAREAMCIHHKASSSDLAVGLQELKERDIIDSRLLKWGEELRKIRNISVHATGEIVSQEDANDILEFVHAIADYVFVLNCRFKQFMDRRGNN